MGIHKIYISPSVQEHNVGYGSYGTEEYRMNLIADWVQYYLNAQGGRFPNKRNSPSMDMKAFCADSNAYNPERHLAIHSNAGPVLAAGTTSYYANGYANSQKYATALYNEIAPLSPGSDRGVKADTTLYSTGLGELRGTKATAALIEVAFHTNPADAQSIIDNARGYGKALAKATVEDCGEVFIDPDVVKPVPVVQPDVLYRVYLNDTQVGAYSVRDNALKKAAEYAEGHVVVKSSTGEVLLDENRIKPAPDPKDTKIAELEQGNALLRGQLDVVTADRDGLKAKIAKALQDLS